MQLGFKGKAARGQPPFRGWIWLAEEHVTYSNSANVRVTTNVAKPKPGVAEGKSQALRPKLLAVRNEPRRSATPGTTPIRACPAIPLLYMPLGQVHKVFKHNLCAISGVSVGLRGTEKGTEYGTG
jgi:hypothetical protein